MKYNSFEDLSVWQKSFTLSVRIYRYFVDLKDYGFKDQITRSALSVSSNIAEGYERDSQKEFVRFLRIAKGSCGELRTQLRIAGEIDYLNKSTANEFINESVCISKMIAALIKKVANST